MDSATLKQFIATCDPSQIATYSRVSTDKQERGNALERMIWDCDRALAALGVAPENVNHYQDTESGSVDFRAGLVTLEAAVESGVRVLVLYRVDRLGRRLTKTANLVDLFISRGVYVFSVRDSKAYDLSQSGDWADFMRLATDAEVEVRRLKERINAGLKYKASVLGHHLGTPPFGLRRVGGALVRDDRQHIGSPLGLSRWDTAMAAIVMILDDSQGLSGSERAGRIAAELGYKKAWTDHIRWALSPATQGHTSNRLSYTANTHDSIVTAEQAAAVTRLRHHSLGKPQRPNGAAADYIFSGLLFCGLCGRRYSGGSKPLSGGGVRVYYRCRGRLTPQSNCYRAKLPPGARAAIPQTELIDYANGLIAGRIPELLAVAFTEESQAPTLSIEDIKAQAELTEIESLISRYGDESGALSGAAAKLRAKLQGLQNAGGTSQPQRLDNTTIFAMQRVADILGASTSATLNDALSPHEYRSICIALISRITLEFDQILTVSLIKY